MERAGPMIPMQAIVFTAAVGRAKRSVDPDAVAIARRYRLEGLQEIPLVQRLKRDGLAFVDAVAAADLSLDSLCASPDAEDIALARMYLDEGMDRFTVIQQFRNVRGATIADAIVRHAEALT